MNDFRQIFLAESVNNLNNLRTNLTQEFFTENLRRESFRTIHTIKGGAQTFGLQNSAHLAGKLENLLVSGENPADKDLLLEGIELLVNSLQSNETDLSADFVEKLDNARQKTNNSEIFLMRIPPKLFRNFSQTEQDAVISALRQEKNIYCAQVCFDVSNFADEYRNLRKVLSDAGEIIASLPGEKFKSAGKIGFRIFLASGETLETLQKLVENYQAEIISYAFVKGASDDLFEIFAQIAAHGANIAEKSGKEIAVTILASDTKFSAEMTKVVFDILLHLVRNAVDHAIEQSGNIVMRLFDESDGLYLSVADDGKGIDLLKVRARAVEKDLISDDDLPDEPQLLELIFASEFSTAERVTEISGRGVGLDAVRNQVEKMNGKISVRNRKTNGTIFEIFLPYEKAV
ncbi:MAG TPA: ATP-binding protein [Pyrinomonadaceae bacterium]|nr:ATP-binding protein [Pyrinomonadaceae bacterium]